MKPGVPWRHRLLEREREGHRPSPTKTQIQTRNNIFWLEKIYAENHRASRSSENFVGWKFRDQKKPTKALVGIFDFLFEPDFLLFLHESTSESLHQWRGCFFSPPGRSLQSLFWWRCEDGPGAWTQKGELNRGGDEIQDWDSVGWLVGWLIEIQLVGRLFFFF